MSRENEEIVRGLFADLTRGDLLAVEARISAAVEWDTSARGSDGSVVHGREAAVAVIRDWLDAWEDASFEVLVLRSAGIALRDTRASTHAARAAA